MDLVEKAAVNLDRAKRDQAKWAKILYEQRKKKRQKDLENAGTSLLACGFGLEKEDLHIGCLLYAMQAMKETPELEEQFKRAGAAILAETAKKTKKCSPN